MKPTLFPAVPVTLPVRHGIEWGAALALGLLLLLGENAQGVQSTDGDWCGWRGDGSGISAATQIPISWSTNRHLLWRTPLPGEGSSSPIIWGDRLFLTASRDGGSNRLVLALDARDGRLLWQRELRAAQIPKTDPKSGYAPATPTTDGKRLYVFFDTPGLLAFDFDGRPLWTLPLGPFKSSYNVAASPVVWRDRVIQCCDHGGEAFILAAEAATGGVLWKTPRALGMQFASPLLIESEGGWQIVMGGSVVKAYDPSTGGELWSCGGMMPCVAPTPVFGDGLVYATSGRNGPTLAIDPTGRGDVSESRVRLHAPTGGPYVPSPLFAGRLLLPSDDGTLRALDARGEVTVVARLRAHFTASPVLAGGRIYWSAENGDTYVLATNGLSATPPSLQLLARNPLGERILASPAIADGRFFLRSERALYAIGGTEDEVSPVAPIAKGGETTAVDELKRRFADHPAADGPDVPVRLTLVEALADQGGAEAVAFLAIVARRDPHWDVSEAAAKAVAASDDVAAVPALVELLADSRSYVKVIAADGLGRRRDGTARSTLLEIAVDRDPLVRCAALRALADLGAAPVADAEAGRFWAVLEAGTHDAEGIVRLAATRAVTSWTGSSAEERTRRLVILRRLASDHVPLIAAAARDALAESDAPGKH